MSATASGSLSEDAQAAGSSEERQDVVPSKPEFIEIGTIAKAFGVRGEIRVRSMTDFPVERLETPGTRYLYRPGDKAPVPVELVAGRENTKPGKPMFHIIRLKGVKTPEQVAELAGCKLLIRSSDRSQPDGEDGELEYHVQDLEGLVMTDEGTGVRGKVVDIYQGTGTYDTLQVELLEGPEAGARFYVPFQRDIVTSVDIEAGVLTADLPQGLVELARANTKTKKRKGGKKGSRREDSERLQRLREKRRAEAEAGSSDV